MGRMLVMLSVMAIILLGALDRAMPWPSGVFQAIGTASDGAGD
jgi:hypothetical protein